MKSLITLTITILNIAVFGQIILTKDNKSLGEKSVFISSCLEGFEKQTVNLNGIEVKTNSYCSCVCDNIIPQLTSDEIITAMKEDDLKSLFFKDGNLEILMNCVEDNMKINDDYQFNNDNQTELSRELQIKSCINEVMNNKDDFQWTHGQAEVYCSCAMDKLYSEGYTYKDLQQIENEDSKTFNEIVVPCISLVINTNNQLNEELNYTNEYDKKDIIGENSSSKVKLIDYLGLGYKIKLEIDGVIKYFLFDTGASDLVINREFERELLINGTLNKDSYLGKDIYLLANNEEVSADIAIIDKIKIGDYTVNNVYVAIIEKGSLLCGNGLLDKFKSWEFKKDISSLILFK